MVNEDQYLDEMEEQEGADGLGTALVVVTTLLLLAAFIVIEMALKGYGAGLFFSGQ